MSGLSIDKSKTALVVIDLQKGVVGRATAPYASDAVVRNAAALAAAFRKNGMPVFLVRVTFVSGLERRAASGRGCGDAGANSSAGLGRRLSPRWGRSQAIS